MEKYLVGVDLDLTLLTDDKKITDYTVNFVKKFVEDGNYFVIATGRPFQGAREFYKRLNVKMPLIATNGGAIFYFEDDFETPKKVIDFSMDKDEFLSLFKEIKGMLYLYNVRTPFSYHYKDYSKIPFYILHEDKMVSMHENDIEISLKANPIDADLMVKENYNDEFLKIVSKYQNFKYIYWGKRDDYFVYEVSSIHASKGLALKYLAELLNIKEENVFGFGDDLNDESLFNYVNGVAMINAVDALKSIAKYITDFDNNHDGVVKFLEKTIYKL